ncbi:MAG: trimethylamine methyltransferase family protein [Deltaproteobacteria bacterium]|nr:trimethylamine methyltransferase family protein [Deltaproteobacteria bacterium]MBW2691760.1 trimethylamine methyltransferase family protein [Deltaproteobacteria bacterium]
MRFSVLSAEEEQRIHEAALCILEEVGLAVTRPSLIARLREHGFPTLADDRVLIPRARVEEALKGAPRSVHLGARDADKQVVLDGTRCFTATGGCGSKTLDIDTGEVRPSSLADVAASARLADAIEEYDVYWTMTSAQDVEPTTRVARGFLAALQNTVKPIQVIDACKGEEAETLALMARQLEAAGAMYGPPVSMLNSVVTPLRLDPDGTEAAMVFAREGLPVVCCSMPIGGVTSPATPAGTVMLAHAEVLAFLTLLQSFYPGCPLIYCPFPVFADPHTGITNYCDPRSEWMYCASLQLGRSTGLPCFGSDYLLSFVSVPDLCTGGGMLETSTVLSLEQLVLDGERVRDVRISIAPQDTSPDALAVDVVRKVGPGGHFLSQRHTVSHMKDFPISKYAGSSDAADEKAGNDEGAPRQRARGEVQRILETHHVEPLPEELEAALLKIAEAEPRAAVA